MKLNLRQFFLTNSVRLVKRNNLDIILVKDAGNGEKVLRNLLYFLVDNRTALFLSGGKTPKNIYSQLAQEKEINPGVVAMIDERYGKPFHADSNEKMIKDSGLLNYFKSKNIPFYNILQENQNLENTALSYDEKVRFLFFNFPRNIGILGIGQDGHTAGLPVKNQKLKSKSQNYVESVDNFSGKLKKRITMTFLGLSMLDYLVVIVFGSEKKKALISMMEDGSFEEVPARFFMRKDIAPKTLLITEQKI
ncbi:MAG: 6-phosphogluconolactonase [Candidatus Levybacteria bacterium]|nr:6-phosphogluconolactonase [Candidatus Levybacteria bacterium]MDZ4227767.1 6-phosphogluconolactonase [Candidatus Levybacteria bacterium]